MEGTDDTMILADNLVKIYKTRDIEVMALAGLDLTVKAGELMAIIGNSGSGKSTFLNLIGGLDRPSAGKLFVDGHNLFDMSAADLVRYKRETVGFVWQNNARNLLPYLTALDNVMTPMMFADPRHRRERAEELLCLVGMEKKKHQRLSQLSGGEQQRVAIAIALANKPRLLLADEPTGSVDRATGDAILSLFARLNKEWGLTVVIVTHDTTLTRQVQRVVKIRDGKISSERVAAYTDLSKVEDLSGGLHEYEQTEYAVLDRAGRIQIPAEILEEMGLSGRQLKLTYENGRVILSPPESGGPSSK